MLSIFPEVIAPNPKIARPPPPKNIQIREGPLPLIRGRHGIAFSRLPIASYSSTITYLCSGCHGPAVLRYFVAQQLLVPYYFGCQYRIRTIQQQRIPCGINFFKIIAVIFFLNVRVYERGAIILPSISFFLHHYHVIRL
jgi:hypothetical protein